MSLSQVLNRAHLHEDATLPEATDHSISGMSVVKHFCMMEGIPVQHYRDDYNREILRIGNYIQAYVENGKRLHFEFVHQDAWMEKIRAIVLDMFNIASRRGYSFA